MIDFKIFARPSPGLLSNIIKLEIPRSIIPSDCIFELYKKQSGMRDWQFLPSNRIINEVEDDNTRGDMKPGISVSYRVIIKNKVTGVIICEAECVLEKAKLNPYAAVAQSNYRRYLIASDSPYFRIYHASLAGEKCSCWDEVREESQDPSCLLCGGTGFEQGFAYVGRERFALLNSNSGESTINEIILNGVLKPSPMQSWTTGQYIIKPKYILMREDSSRAYEVISANPSVIKDVLIKQDIIFKEVEEGTPIYNHIKEASF